MKQKKDQLSTIQKRKASKQKGKRKRKGGEKTFLKSTEDSVHFKCISANRGTQPGDSSSHRIQNPPAPRKKIVIEDE